MNAHHARVKSIIARGEALRCIQRKGFLFPLFAMVLCLFSTVPLSAQFESAALNGTIRDQSGAVVPGATVSARNVDTGLIKESTTNAQGIYNIVQIPPGNYTVTATATGFSTVERKGVTLSIAQTLSADFKLKPGSANESVSVTGDTGAELTTSSTEISSTLDSEMVNDLPTLGRNYTQLLILNPGTSSVVGDGQTGTRTVNPGPAIYPEIQGASPRSNVYRLDGTGNNEAISGDQIITPIPDDIQQVKVMNHNDSAMFGQGLGGTINVITKSGTNQLHGSAWEYWRNPQFGDAKPGPIFDPTAAELLPQEHQNQYGFSLGGPVWLPHIYDGHNKSFWYFSWEGFKYSNARTIQDSLPTEAMYGGDFSSLLQRKDVNGNPIRIYNPYTGEAFQNNQIPTNMIDQNVVNLLKGVTPQPNGCYDATCTVNYQAQSPIIQDSNQFDVRGDEYLTRKDQIWGHILWTKQKYGSQGYTADFLSGNGFKGKNIGAQWIHTFSPSSVLTVAFGHNDGIQDPDGATYFGSNVDDLVAPFKDYTCGFNNSIRSSGCLMPGMAITGYYNYFPSEQNQAPTGLSHIWEYKADYMQNWRKHTFYAGFDIAQNNQGLVVQQYADEVFDSTQTSLPNADGTFSNIGGNGLASALLSVPWGYWRGNVMHTETGGWVNGVYGMDSWKLRDNLTINIGLRWDVSILPRLENPYGNYYGIFDFDNGTYILQDKPSAVCKDGEVGAPCLWGGTLPDHVVLSPNKGQLYKSDWGNFQPRVGIAWQMNPRMVWHLSYGRTYDNWAAVEQTAGNADSWLEPTSGTWEWGSIDLAVGGPFRTAENPGSIPQFTPAASPFGNMTWNSRPQIRNPYSDQWTFGLEQSINATNKLAMHYVGSAGRKLDYEYLGGTAKVPSATDPNANGNLDKAPFPYMGRSYYDIPIGKSDYHALEVQFNGRTRGAGLSYILSYTWSKILNIGTDSWYGAGSTIEDPYHPERDRGPAGYDLSHVFTAGWTFAIPVGKNHYSTGSRLLDYVLGNWKLNGIASIQSGPVYSIITPGDIAHTGNVILGNPGGAYERADITPGKSWKVSSPSYTAGFNTEAFTRPLDGTFGNSGRNSLRAPSIKNLDTAIFREFPFWEAAKLQLRLDAFNFLNHPNLGTPDNCMNCDATFGQIRGWSSTPRRLQLSGKIVF